MSTDTTTPDASEALPEVYEGTLDGPLFEAYFADLESYAVIRSVRTRSGPRESADDDLVDLGQARLLLVLGRALGAQVRYEHEGVAWIDTLVRRADSIRLLRTRDPIQPRGRALRVLRPE